MKSYEIFEHTAPNGVDVPAIVVSVIYSDTWQTQYLCYSQHRLFTYFEQIEIDPETDGYSRYCFTGETLVEYAVLPEFDAWLNVNAYPDWERHLEEERQGINDRRMEADEDPDYLDECFQSEIDSTLNQLQGFTYMSVEDWESDWDTENRKKQITRLAHELADKHEHLSIFDWANLVYPFYQMYELSSDERQLFTQEYHSQHYFRYGYV